MAKMTVLSACDIKRVFTVDDALRAVEEAYRQKAVGSGKAWPMVYEEILKGYAYDGSSGTYDLTIGLPTILQSNALTDLGLTIGTSEVGGRTYLSTINAVLGLASISGETGSGIARIELNASLSSIGEDVFWNQEGNAYATYLAAHGGDAYTVL